MRNPTQIRVVISCLVPLQHSRWFVIKQIDRLDEVICWTHHASVGVLGAVAEGGCQGGRAALVVVRILTVIDSAVDRDSPHASRIAIAVAVVVLSTIATRPHVYITKSIATLSKKLNVNYTLQNKSCSYPKKGCLLIFIVTFFHFSINSLLC